MNKVSTTVLFHNYYGMDDRWIDFFCTNIKGPFSLLYNTVLGSYYRNDFSAKAPFACLEKHQLIWRSSSNIGKDIGGKLVLLDAYIRLGLESSYLLIMHDKKSLYHSNHSEWSTQLFKIANKANSEKVLALFESNSNIGIIASKRTIRNGHQGKDPSYYTEKTLNHLSLEYKLSPPSPTYVAGTMFWVRSSIYKDFFLNNPPLEIRRKLEKGNVLDHEMPTVTHLWERIMSWIVTSSGYKIIGI